MSKHTPGPWRVDGNSVMSANDINVHDVRFGGGTDAALIAAAPELLEACKYVNEWFETIKKNQYKALVEDRDWSPERWDEVTSPEPLNLEKLKQVIAKAEGR